MSLRRSPPCHARMVEGRTGRVMARMALRNGSQWKPTHKSWSRGRAELWLPLSGQGAARDVSTTSCQPGGADLYTVPATAAGTDFAI
jgi:hypothetical protein